MSLKLLTLLVVAGVVLAGCGQKGPDPLVAAQAKEIAALEARIEELNGRVDAAAPDLAVLMAGALTQHGKLYYAGKARNWELAAYALHETNEALQEVQDFEDPLKQFPTPFSELVPPLVGPALGAIHMAIRAKDGKQFDEAFNTLTQACNACHATLNHGFIQVQAPTAREFTNQKF